MKRNKVCIFQRYDTETYPLVNNLTEQIQCNESSESYFSNISCKDFSNDQNEQCLARCKKRTQAAYGLVTLLLDTVNPSSCKQLLS